MPPRDDEFAGLEPRTVVWSDPLKKARWLDAHSALDAVSLPVRNLAGRFAAAMGAMHPDAIARQCYAFVRDGIKYSFKGDEEFPDSATVLLRGFADCNGKARLLNALLKSVAIDAHTRAVFRDDGVFSHVQVVTRYPGSDAHPYAGEGGWIGLDPIVADLPYGWPIQAAHMTDRGEVIVS